MNTSARRLIVFIKMIKMENILAKELLFKMYRIRQVELKIAEMYSEQEMRCPIHLSVGQEAVATGICQLLRKEDSILSAHRSHAHYIAKGGSIKKMLGELYGKISGCAKGKGGSMHLIDLEAGLIAAVPIVGSTIPIGVGVAWGKKLKNKKDKTAIFFGEGATETGVFHESLGFASLHNIPVIFICENNLYSVYTHVRDRQSKKRSLKTIVEGHGIQYLYGNGNNMEEVLNISKQSIEYIETKQLPILLEFDTYRWLEHCGPGNDDHLNYRDEQETKSWLDNCPINLFEKKLLISGAITKKEIDENLEALNNEILEAFMDAKNAEFLPASSLYDDIYSV